MATATLMRERLVTLPATPERLELLQQRLLSLVSASRNDNPL